MVPSALRAAPGDCAPEYVFETAEFRLVQCVHHEAADTALKVKPARARWVKANHLMPAPGMKSGLPVPFVKYSGFRMVTIRRAHALSAQPPTPQNWTSGTFQNSAA
jgi:hypothetical protein